MLGSFWKRPWRHPVHLLQLNTRNFWRRYATPNCLFRAHFVFSFCPLFSFHKLQKYFVFVAKVQEKIASHAECGCVNLIDKVLEVNALNDFFLHNFFIWCTTLHNGVIWLLTGILQFSFKVVLMLFNTTLMGWQNCNKKTQRELLEVVVKSSNH